VENDEILRSASVVRFINHGTNIQLLCSDERGLLSVYLSPKTFSSFYKKVHKSGLQLAGLIVKFNRDLLGVPALGNRRNSFPLLSSTTIHAQV
jgi:hypothetical protein